MDKNISLKYPIIFVHGIIAHDRFKYFSFGEKFQKYWRKAV